MKATLLKTTITTALAVASLQAQTVDLGFDSARAGGDVTWTLGVVDAGEVTTASSASLTSWTMSFTEVDIFGTGDLYDGTVTVDVDASAEVSYDLGNTRYDLSTGATLDFNTPTLVLTDSAGASNSVLADSLLVTFSSYTSSGDSSISNGESIVLSGLGVPGAPITRSNNSNEDPFDVTGAQELLYDQTVGPSVRLFGLAGEFQVAVPEPRSYAALVGVFVIGCVALRRRF